MMHNNLVEIHDKQYLEHDKMHLVHPRNSTIMIEQDIRILFSTCSPTRNVFIRITVASSISSLTALPKRVIYVL